VECEWIPRDSIFLFSLINSKLVGIFYLFWEAVEGLAIGLLYLHRLFVVSPHPNLNSDLLDMHQTSQFHLRRWTRV
jgi:hypothetical protein